MSFLIYEKDGPVVTLTMDQPEKRNPLSGNTALEELVAAVERIHDDRSVRAVILTGNGPAFSAGGDIGVIQRQATSAVSEMDIRQEYRRGIQRVTAGLYNLEVPVIAAINGHAVGAGLGLACMCDIRIASENAKMGAGFIKLGIIPGDGSTWLLPRIVGPSRAAEFFLTGDTIDAQTALEWRLVSQVVAADQLMAVAKDMAGRIARNPEHSVRLTKRLLREAMRSSLETVLELSAMFQAVSHKTPDHSEAVSAFLEKRPPQYS
jgi:enoyl-CoA hydratase/carnithine racemase